jgi:hypothetical protein
MFFGASRESLFKTEEIVGKPFCEHSPETIGAFHSFYTFLAARMCAPSNHTQDLIGSMLGGNPAPSAQRAIALPSREGLKTKQHWLTAAWSPSLFELE